MRAHGSWDRNISVKFKAKELQRFDPKLRYMSIGNESENENRREADNGRLCTAFKYADPANPITVHTTVPLLTLLYSRPHSDLGWLMHAAAPV